jgi:hypothetical protein
MTGGETSMWAGRAAGIQRVKLAGRHRDMKYGRKLGSS